MQPFDSVLIANRGEIACRLIRACQELGLRAVAVYSEADAHALHVRLADAAVPIGAAAPGASYLRGEKLIAAAHAAGAQAIHPGYGFLSENASFAEAVAAAGLVFVGPPAQAIRLMGSKTAARTRMQAAGVPVVPGFHGTQAADLASAAAGIGYPVLVKAAGGGGGRGMRVVRAAAELAAALESAAREAEHAFGDPELFLEKYIERGRHIEFQVFADAHGNTLHLYERECSVQRRHQKVIEESPSPLLSLHPELRTRMGQAAVLAARAVAYRNAGTVEFIVDPDRLQFYFLEMNTRLQVEHPVTEAVTGLDLVRLQLLVAAGQPLPFSQSEVALRGHAVECRVYAEDPANDFLPSIGTVLKTVPPSAPGLRVDSGYETGDEVPQYYDALLAKVIAHAATRAAAIEKMDAALARYVWLGLTTNLAFLRALLAHPEIQAGTATTRLIETHFAGWRPPQPLPPPEALAALALADSLGAASAAPGGGPPAFPDPWERRDRFRLGGA